MAADEDMQAVRESEVASDKGWGRSGGYQGTTDKDKKERALSLGASGNGIKVKGSKEENHNGAERCR